MDDKTNIESLRQKALEFRDARDWGQFHDPKNLATGLSIESAELLELFLWKDSREVKEFISDPAGRHRVGEELADTFIYLLYLSDACDLDISEVVLQKLESSAKKYPVEKSFGNHKKYTEL